MTARADEDAPFTAWEASSLLAAFSLLLPFAGCALLGLWGLLMSPVVIVSSVAETHR